MDKNMILIVIVIIIIILLFGCKIRENKDTENFISSMNNSVINYDEIPSSAKVKIESKLNDLILNIDNIIKSMKDNNEKGEIDKGTINKIYSKYEKILNKIQKRLTNEELYFDIEQETQDKMIEDIRKELSIVQFQLEEELRKKDKTNYQINSVKNPSSGLILNVHNTSAINDGYKFNNLIDVDVESGVEMYGKKLNMMECIETCKTDPDCKGVSFDESKGVCQKRADPPDFSNNNSFKSWEKDDNFMILMNGKCLSYTHDILVVRNDSAINSWHQCHGKNIGVVVVYENLKNGAKVLEDGGMGSRKYEIKGTTPIYTEYKYSVVNDSKTKTSNETEFKKMIDDLYGNRDGNQKIVGIRIPHNKNARKMLVNMINIANVAYTASGLIGFKMININSSYDLSNCNGTDSSQLFKLTDVAELNEYNKLVRDNNADGLKYNYEYNSISEVPSTKDDDESKLMEQCDLNCKNLPGCKKFSIREVGAYKMDDCNDPGAKKNGDWCECKTGFEMNKSADGRYYGNRSDKFYKYFIGRDDYKCVLKDPKQPHYDTTTKQCIINPEIHFNSSVNTAEKCRDACKVNASDRYGLEYENCFGATFDNVTKQCKGSTIDNGYFNKNPKAVAWEKYSGNELRSLKNVPVPFSVIRPKDNIDTQVNNNINECLTTHNGSISIEPCNLGVYQRWNPSHKIRDC